MLPLLITIAVLSLAAVVLLLLVLFRKPEVAFADRVRKEVDRLNETLHEELRNAREESANASRQLREEITNGVRALGESLAERQNDDAARQMNHLQTFSTALTESSERGEQRLAEMRETLDQRLATAAELQQQTDAQTRQELQSALKSFSELLAGQLQDLSLALKQQLSDLTTRNETKLEAMRTTVETKLTQVQSDNETRLERIRATVDEKLHATLEQRLGESFKLVSDRLEQVHSGLGEMRTLATGVGDLKKVLTNIKTRGTWGEVQLGNLLAEIFTPDQYAQNVAPNPDSAERVEYAVKYPGREESGAPVWLPIDAKFPQEEYQRLVDAQERGDVEAAESASAALESGVKTEAKKICDKYVHPPHTLDFAILFLPTEGLFAEVLRRPGLCDSIRRDHRVILSGPTTLSATLMSLQMGFRTLAIEKRSSEVWNVLGAVKTEFGKFGDALEKVKRKLNEASSSIEAAETRHRVVAGKLRKAEELPPLEAAQVLNLDAAPGDDTATLELPGIRKSVNPLS